MRLLIVFFMCMTVGCAELSGSRAPAHASAVQIRDVPFAARAAQQGPRHRILVLPFLTQEVNGSAKMARQAREGVIRDLSQTGEFVVVSMSDFPQDPKTFLNEKHEYDLAKVSKTAAALGVSAVVEGKILDVHANRMGDSLGLIREVKANVSAEVRVRVYAAGNGKEIMKETRTADTEATSTHIGDSGQLSLAENPYMVQAAIVKAFHGLAGEIARSVEKLSWEGRVALVAGDHIYVNAGRLTGLQIGDILKVTEQGQDVYDPETGRFIGTAPGRLKGTIEIVSYFGKDGSIAVIHSGSGFQQNDRVELY